MGQMLYDKETGGYVEIGDDGVMRPVGTAWREAQSNEEMLYKLGSEAVQDFATLAGGAFADTGRGAMSLLGLADRDLMLAEQAAEMPAREAARARSPAFAFLGDISPEVTAGLVSGGRLLPTMALGAAEGVRLRPDVGDQQFNAIAGTLTPFGVDILGRVWKSARGLVELTEESRRAKAAGIPYTAGDAAGGGFAKRLDDMAEDLPFSNLFAEDPADVGQTLINRWANEAIGETGDKVTKANLSAAVKRNNAVYKATAQRLDEAGPIRLPDDVQEAIVSLLNRKGQRKALGQFQGLFERNDGVISGSELLDLHKLMVKQADTVGSNDPILGRVIQNSVLKRLDDIIEPRLGDDGLEQWQRAREQFRFHHLLTSGKSVTGGNVNAPTLANRTQKNMPEVIQRGEGERLYTDEGRRLVEAVDLGADPTLRAGNQSGTPRRAGTIGTLGAGGAVAADIMTGSPGLFTGAAAGVGIGNPLWQYASRTAPDLVGGAFASGSVRPAVTTGALLDELMYPFVGAEDERQP